MRKNNDIATEIDGKRVCDHCEEPVDSITPIVVDFGEVELCKQCLTEDATKEEVNQTALRRQPRCSEALSRNSSTEIAMNEE